MRVGILGRRFVAEYVAPYRHLGAAMGRNRLAAVDRLLDELGGERSAVRLRELREVCRFRPHGASDLAVPSAVCTVTRAAVLEVRGAARVAVRRLSATRKHDVANENSDDENPRSSHAPSVVVEMDSARVGRRRADLKRSRDGSLAATSPLASAVVSHPVTAGPPRRNNGRVRRRRPRRSRAGSGRRLATPELRRTGRWRPTCQPL